MTHRENCTVTMLCMRNVVCKVVISLKYKYLSDISNKSEFFFVNENPFKLMFHVQIISPCQIIILNINIPE